jgi:FKBP-type peptidyl-prolyl cis-trans isomerase FklB
MATLLAFHVAAQPSPPSSPPISTNPRAVPPAQATPMPPPVMPERQKMSTAIGMYFGNNISNTLQRQELDVDRDTLISALKNALEGRTNQMSLEEMTATLKQLTAASRAKLQEAQREKLAKEGLENRTKGGEFLMTNAKLDGVKSLPDGLQYKILKDGSGDMPKPTDTVTVNYKGTLIDGTSFDSRSNFTTAVTGRTIKGWSEILPLMKVGSEWQVVIPPDLGYGSQPHGAKIGPDAVLIFDMELVSIAPAKPAIPVITTTPPAPASGSPVVSGQIIKVPSAEDLKKGAKIEVITNVPPGQ